MLSITELRSSYLEAHADGQTIAELAERLGVKLTSLSQRLTLLRGDLRKAGATEDQIRKILPSLKRQTGPRVSNRSAVLAAMLADVE